MTAEWSYVELSSASGGRHADYEDCAGWCCLHATPFDTSRPTQRAQPTVQASRSGLEGAICLDLLHIRQGRVEVQGISRPQARPTRVPPGRVK